MLMKKYLILLAVFFLLHSCGESEELAVEKKYELVDIQFTPADESGAEKVTVDFEGGHVFNRVSETVFYSSTRKNVLHDESDFSMMSDVPIEIASRNDIKVNIPGVAGATSSMEALFTSVPQYVERVFEHVSNKVVIPPFYEYKGTCRVHGYKESKEFSATFKEVHSGEIVHVKGEWHGTRYLDSEVLEVYRSLE